MALSSVAVSRFFNLYDIKTPFYRMLFDILPVRIVRECENKICGSLADLRT